MERLLTSLHDLLDPETDPPPRPTRPAVLPLSLKCSYPAQRLRSTYLHERSPPVIHRDLSPETFSDSGIGAKIVIWRARIVPLSENCSHHDKGPGPQSTCLQKPVLLLNRMPKVKYDAVSMSSLLE
ncbi:hypothetical protein GBAR_LOCUS17918 [Geodia barretti]|uniref:Uncharacterized protein n=1 Tax=Geodia barretti TaxID=519541 RepID=A0AA35SLY1_GEOBA|nr:hypothetical protein GBAR_LOCUS17918 [Geodia barretti]